MRIKQTGLSTPAAVSLNKSNGTFYQGTDSQIFRAYFALSLYANAVFDAIVYPSAYNGPQVAIWDADDVTVTSAGDVPSTTPKYKKVSIRATTVSSAETAIL